MPWPLDEHISGFPIPSDTAAIFNPALPRAPSRTHDLLYRAAAETVAGAARTPVLSGDCAIALAVADSLQQCHHAMAAV